MHDGIILFRKKAGFSSFRSLNPLKKALGKKVKVGHTGTLDQFAEGLLVVLSGSLTRLNPQFSAFDKEYEARIVFGQETDTLDPEGSVIKEMPLVSDGPLEAVLRQFEGPQQQMPPLYSAISVQGVRSSDRVRAGEQVELKSRAITLYRLRLVNKELNNEGLLKAVTLNIVCSKGTYIRSFARDLAYALGTCAHVSQLVRLGIGLYRPGKAWNFLLEDAVDADQFDPERDIRPPAMLADLFPDTQVVRVKNDYKNKVTSGMALKPEWLVDSITAGQLVLLEENGHFLAMACREQERFRYLFVRAN